MTELGIYALQNTAPIQKFQNKNCYASETNKETQVIRKTSKSH